MNIWVFEQFNSAQNKITGIRRFGKDDFVLQRFGVDIPLPPVLDDTADFLPQHIEADLVLDHFKHADLSQDLARLCFDSGIPMISPGKKIRFKGIICPPTCCGLTRQPSLGIYGERFGAPELRLKIKNGRIDQVHVKRGAPCAATWEAARRIIGCPADDAPVRFGLEVQYFCSADPAGWDPIHGKSPVHFAGHIHRKALEAALAVLKQKAFNP